MSKFQLCPKCREGFRKAGHKGGKNGSHEAKVEAGRKGGISKADAKVDAGRMNLIKARRIRSQLAKRMHGEAEIKVL